MRGSRTIARLALLAVLVVTALAAMAGPAVAHAQLEGSDPHAGDVLATPPARVTLSFGEPVESARDAIQVFDDRLQRVDLAAVSTVSGARDRIQVRLRPRLHRG